jgi:hypothetical protein
LVLVVLEVLELLLVTVRLILVLLAAQVVLD